ncbi:MAG: hypothetical protein KAV00_06885 [Phycisphaerae bacterium]|nr:hypothetical protein [Phycisphaerae bacterium]
MADAYKAYRGLLRACDIDWATSLASTGAGNATITITAAGHTADTIYYYGLRPTKDDLETPNISCVCEFVTAADGDWLGNKPASVLFAEAEVRAGGVIRLGWRYRMFRNGTEPDDFAIWHGTTDDLGTGSPDQTITYTGPASFAAASRYYKHDFTLTDGRAYYFRIVARVGAIESDAVTIGPFLADSSAPATPTLYTAKTFAG